MDGWGRSLRIKAKQNYEEHNNIDDEIEGKRTFFLEEKLNDEKFEYNLSDFVLELEGKDFDLKYIQENGFNTPILFKKKDGLGMRLPDPELFTINDVKSYVGARRTVEVFDCDTHQADSMSMQHFVRYYTGIRREKILNVTSLEFSHTGLDRIVDCPTVVREDLDWVPKVWPSNLISEQKDTTNLFENMKYPKVRKYVLMSVAGCYTDFHIDFGGSSVWYHILKGAKVFWLIRPTEANLAIYEQWALSGRQQDVFFGDLVKNCYRIHLIAGDTVMIPTGWIHGVYTPDDSLVFGGNYLHSYNIPMQLRVYDIEENTHTPRMLRYPFFMEIHWYIIKGYVDILERDMDEIRMEEFEDSQQDEGVFRLMKEEVQRTTLLDTPMWQKVYLTIFELEGLREICNRFKDWDNALSNFPKAFKENASDLIERLQELLQYHEDDNQILACSGINVFKQYEEAIHFESNKAKLIEAKEPVNLVQKKLTTGTSFQNSPIVEIYPIKSPVDVKEIQFDAEKKSIAIPKLMKDANDLKSSLRSLKKMCTPITPKNEGNPSLVVEFKGNSVSASIFEKDVKVAIKPLLKRLTKRTLKPMGKYIKHQSKPLLKHTTKYAIKSTEKVALKSLKKKSNSSLHLLRQKKFKKRTKGYGIRRVRCHECAGCIRNNCNQCKFCVDHPRNGGDNRLRQSCALRFCVDPQLPSYVVCLHCKGGRDDAILMECSICWEIVHPKCLEKTYPCKISKRVNNLWECPNCCISEDEEVTEYSDEKIGGIISENKLKWFEELPRKLKKKRKPMKKDFQDQIDKRKAKQKAENQNNTDSEPSFKKSRPNIKSKKSVNAVSNNQFPALTVVQRSKIIRPAPLLPSNYCRLENGSNHSLKKKSWIEIFLYLTKNDITNCMLVCKAWNQWCLHGQLWERIDLSFTSINKIILSGIVRRQPKFLNFSSVKITGKQFEWLLNRLPCLQELNLSLNTAPIISSLIRANCPRIKHFNLSWCDGIYDRFLIHVFSVAWTNSTVHKTSNSLSYLETLDLSGCNIGDDVVHCILTTLSKLKLLNISHCNRITKASFELITQNGHISNDLKKIIFVGCTVLSDEFIDKFNNLPDLPIIVVK